MIVVNQTYPQAATEIAMVAPMQLVMPVPIGGYGYDHHFHHHYDSKIGISEDSLGTRITVGHRGCDREDAGFDATIDSGYD